MHDEPALSRREALGAAGMVIGAATASATALGRPAPKPAPSNSRLTPLYPRESATRSVRDLSGLWRFRLDPHDRGETERWFDGLADTRPIPVPCSWNDLFDDAADYFGAAWYETDLRLDPAWSGRRVHLRFGSAVYRAKVWLNGQLLGEHLGGHLPFAFEVTGVARAGELNRLTVMVENKLRVDRVPAIPDPATSHFTFEDYPQTSYDFFPYSGLHRPVWLHATPRDFIEDVRVVTRREGATGLVDVDVRASGGWSGAASLELSDGGAPIRQSLDIEGGAGHATVRIPGATLWSPDRPHLYTLTVRLSGRTVVDEYALRIGIRTVEVSGTRLLLNGEPIQLKGFGKHEDFFLHGRGLDLPVLVRDYELLKWIGANSFRTSHYPYSEEAMMLADEYGFLVIGETPAVSLTFSDRSEVVEARRVQLRADVEDLIARDKNHPSVILWSMANESLTRPFHIINPAPADAVAKGTRFFADIFAHARSLDPSRPVAMVSVQGGPVEWVSQGDVICANSYNGWYALSGRLEDAAEVLRHEITVLHQRCGAKPVIVTEFGADAMAGIHGQPAQMFSEDYQADIIAMYLDVLGTMPFVVGTHPWCFADFRTAQSIMRVGAMNLKGVFTRDRRPKRAAHLLRERWAGVRQDDWTRAQPA